MIFFKSTEEKNEFQNRLTAYRRDFHSHPESGFTEFRTTAIILSRLQELGIPVQFGRSLHCPDQMLNVPSAEELVYCQRRAIEELGLEDVINEMTGGFTGCVGIIEGNYPGPTIAMRFDIDCNEVLECCEEEHRPYREGFASCYENRMHACGHDGHAAIGLGVAELIARNKSELHGKVKLIFQPAEEGVRGAYSLIGTDLLDDVDYLIGAHIGLKMAHIGDVAVSTKDFLACNMHEVEFLGRQAHAAAAPEYGHNALAAAATAALNILGISRHSRGFSRVNVANFIAKGESNIVPAEARMVIEVRGETNEVNDYMSERADEICKAAATMHECTYNRKYIGGVWSAECDKALISHIMEHLKNIPDIKNIVPAASMGAGDDITFMIRTVQKHGGQATYMMLGADHTAPHHSSTFDFDENVLSLGAEIYASIAFSGLSESK